MQGNLTIEERFWAKVEKTETCWLWTGLLDRYGYGRLWLDGKMAKAHRYAYELLVGQIPNGLTLDHLCRVRNCVNPADLEPVTGRENTLRGEGVAATHARRTHCPRGHLFDEANTYLRPSSGRRCRACQRNSQRAHRAVRLSLIAMDEMTS